MMSEEEEKALAHRLRREDICEAIGSAVMTILLFVALYVFALVTPDQMSAENDLTAEVAE